jgi:hypothetical protein
MRLAAQAKLGFYPAPPEAVSLAWQYLAPPDNTFAMLDPCTGQGAAIRQIHQALGGAVYAIELDEGRAADVKAALPDATILARASFFGVSCTPGSFSFVWCNPPFDDEIGGGYRTEHTFLVRATGWLKAGGILALVCPEHVAKRWDLEQYLGQWYDDLALLPFPDEHRAFHEVIVFGVKRTRPVQANRVSDWSPPQQVYQIPPGKGPRQFTKVDFTDAELARELLRSPLLKHLEPPPELAVPEPPLPLGTGHLALLLAVGHLNGVVRPEGEPPHVVRGTARKTQYVSAVEENQGADGSVTTKTTVSERIQLVVRILEADGTLTTLEQE